MKFTMSFYSAAIAMLASIGGVGAAFSQEVGKLYAPKPPAGSAFVRIVSALDGAASVKLGSLAPVDLKAGERSATNFRLLKGGAKEEIAVNGTPLGEPVDVPVDSFVTVLLWNEGGAVKDAVITDQTRGHDDLKAELRVYSLLPNCNGEIVITSGPTVFKDVATGSSQRRSINPVKADLQGKCGDAVSAPVSLPDLKAGDRFSLFLSGTAEKPVLTGQVDQTEM